MAFAFACVVVVVAVVVTGQIAICDAASGLIGPKPGLERPLRPIRRREIMSSLVCCCQQAAFVGKQETVEDFSIPDEPLWTKSSINLGSHELKIFKGSLWLVISISSIEILKRFATGFT